MKKVAKPQLAVVLAMAISVTKKPKLLLDDISKEPTNSLRLKMTEQNDVKEIEEFLTKEFETEFKFSGFINGNGPIKYKFIPTDSSFFPIADTIEHLQEALS
jgi:hypothetical protein